MTKFAWRLGLTPGLLSLVLACSTPEAPRAMPDPEEGEGGSEGGGGSGRDGGSFSGRRDAGLETDTNVVQDAGPLDRPGSAPDAVGAEPSPDASGGTGGAGGDAGGGQGPVAEGMIVFSQDFEKDMAGLTPSPTSIPAARYQRVDDPLGMRGKVMRVVWEAGDNFRTSPGNKPRSAISNTGYSFPFGSKVSYALGYMITSLDINATFAQHIRPGGPMWMLEGHNEGDLIVRCGGTTALMKRLEINRWYDIRVEVDYRSNGYVQVYIDGDKVYERTDNLGFAAPKDGAAHWDGGIYNTELGISNNRTRTVYISNLSVGRK